MDNLQILPGYGHSDEILSLFEEYMEMLLRNDPSFAAYLKLQNYDAEVQDLSRKYGIPDGRLYIALWNGEPAGCIALRKLDAQRCEMKRMYVRPQFRRMGIARCLIQQLLSDAKEIGYSFMLLDTLPFLKDAIHMYRSMGFYDIPCYNDTPIKDTVFLQMDL